MWDAFWVGGGVGAACRCSRTGAQARQACETAASVAAHLPMGMSTGIFPDSGTVTSFEHRHFMSNFCCTGILRPVPSCMKDAVLVAELLFNASRVGPPSLVAGTRRARPSKRRCICCTGQSNRLISLVRPAKGLMELPFEESHPNRSTRQAPLVDVEEAEVVFSTGTTCRP